jgi:hypothetical protein
MSLITAADLLYMQGVELEAMASTGTIYRLSYSTTPLGNQDEVWVSQGTVPCDVWAIGAGDVEKPSSGEQVAKSEYYISVPVSTNILAADIIDISSITYQITFVPKSQTWQTNIRLEAVNYNNELRVKT